MNDLQLFLFLLFQSMKAKNLQDWLEKKSPSLMAGY